MVFALYDKGMRLAVISDIHANLVALEEVLTDMGRAQVDEIAALGDLVGYGPEPEAVVTIIRKQQIPSILGNHEFALLNEPYCARLNPPTRKTLDITRELLSPDSLQFFTTLKQVMVRDGIRFVHGCPPTSFTAYLFSPQPNRLQKLFASYDQRLCFVGHTHDLALHSTDGRECRTAALTEGVVLLEKGRRYIVNAGSVGQPRDSQGNNAKYVIWDSENDSLEVRFVPYDIAKTAEKILALGFPEYNAHRLW